MFDNNELMEELRKNVYKIAQRLWTGADRCGGAGGEELCAIVNLALWTDDRTMSDDLAMFCRCINPTLTRRDEDAHFPPGGIIYRGAALPDSCLKFYREVFCEDQVSHSAFVATSFDKSCAIKFLDRAWKYHQKHTPRPGVLFVIQVDPRGEDDRRIGAAKAPA